MQIQETTEYDAKTLLQTVLEGMKSPHHADRAAHPKHGDLRRTYAFQSKRRQTKSEKG